MKIHYIIFCLLLSSIQIGCGDGPKNTPQEEAPSTTGSDSSGAPPVDSSDSATPNTNDSLSESATPPSVSDATDTPATPSDNNTVDSGISESGGTTITPETGSTSTEPPNPTLPNVDTSETPPPSTGGSDSSSVTPVVTPINGVGPGEPISLKVLSGFGIADTAIIWDSANHLYQAQIVVGNSSNAYYDTTVSVATTDGRLAFGSSTAIYLQQPDLDILAATDLTLPLATTATGLTLNHIRGGLYNITIEIIDETHVTLHVRFAATIGLTGDASAITSVKFVGRTSFDGESRIPLSCTGAYLTQTAGKEFTCTETHIETGEYAFLIQTTSSTQQTYNSLKYLLAAGNTVPLLAGIDLEKSDAAIPVTITESGAYRFIVSFENAEDQARVKLEKLTQQ